MNREIKFRGKTLDNKWVYGMLTNPVLEVDNVEPGYYISNPAGQPFAYIVKPETIGQYTVLKDKNGNDIWEGDIFKEDNSGIVRSIFCVPGGFAFEDNPIAFGYDHRAPVYPYSSIAELQNASWLSQCCEIVGNIHDNPELLKEGINHENKTTTEDSKRSKKIFLRD